MVFADIPKKGENTQANHYSPAKIVEARWIENPDRDHMGKHLQLRVSHIGKLWPSSVIYFAESKASEVYRMFLDQPSKPEDLLGRNVHALTRGPDDNATYGII
ncbi:MAG: hypothetical protein ABIH92_03510 [Nanoarchaeota archaeon]